MSDVPSVVDRALSRWWEPYPPRDAEERLRLGLLWAVAGAGLLTASAMATAHLIQGQWGLALFFGAAALMLLGVHPLTRRRRSPMVASRFALGVSTLCLWTAGATGASPLSGVVAATPIVLAGLIGGERTLSGYVAATLIYLLGFTDLPPREALVATLVLSVGAWGCVRTLRHAREEAGERRAREDEAQAALERSESRAQTAYEAQARDLAVMSHELRTPMNGILGLSELLLEEQLSPSARVHAETLRGSARALRVVMDDLLDLSREDGEKVLLVPQPVALGRVCEEVLDLAQCGGRAAGVDLRFDPCPPKTMGVRLDDLRLRQVLTNLVSRALKVTRKGWVRLGVEVHRGRLRFEVEDTSPGIPQDSMPTLFDAPSSGAPLDSRTFAGTGLGLAISRRLVEAMGGSLGVDAPPGRGATFWFELPLERCAPPPRILPEAGSVDLPGHGPVVVVDDNSVNRLVATKLLTRIGVETEALESGAAAVERLRKGDVRAVLMDVQMPDMDGFEATRRIRAEEEEAGRRRVPILGYSANVLPEDVRTGHAAGMDGYLAKPAERERLVATLMEALLRHH
ncbi:MAG: ATP-binding protein [Myxococcota bacterium]